MFPYAKRQDSVSVFIEDRIFTVKSTESHFEEVLQAIKDEDSEKVKHLVDRVSLYEEFCKDSPITIKGGFIIDDEYIPTALSNKIIDLKDNGFSIDPFVNFWRLLKKNLYPHCVNQLYNFIESGDWCIFPNGRILAYKAVYLNPYKGQDLTDDKIKSLKNSQTARMDISFEDYKKALKEKTYIDIHSGSVPQDIGDTVEVFRYQVDDNPDAFCSKGLHVCLWDYAMSFGGSRSTILNVSVSPEDWVSVPSDNTQKARVSKYTIQSVNTNSRAYNSAVAPEETSYSYKDYWGYEDDEDDDEDTEFESW